MLNEKGGHFSLKWTSFTRYNKALAASSYYQRLRVTLRPVTTHVLQTPALSLKYSLNCTCKDPTNTHTELEKNFLHLRMSGKKALFYNMGFVNMVIVVFNSLGNTRLTHSLEIAKMLIKIKWYNIIVWLRASLEL